MKILIVEDIDWVAKYMAEVLSGLGEITLCTTTPDMPSKAEAIALIEQADVVLLDNDLGTDYCGEDLLPYCKKKVLGISSDTDFGTPRFRGDKMYMYDDPARTKVFVEFVTKEVSTN